MRAVVITGASAGIGRACALRLAGNGFRVFAGYRKEEDAVSLADEATENQRGKAVVGPPPGASVDPGNEKLAA